MQTEVECQLLDDLSEAIARRVGKQKYKIWFKNSARIDIEDDYVKIGVPNQFIASWIEGNFNEQIISSVEDVYKSTKKAIYYIQPELFNGGRRRVTEQSPELTSIQVNKEKAAQKSGKNAPFRMNLDDFVVGPCNQMAFNASMAVVEQPEARFNPLFIHGDCGLGKTHLLQGICNAINMRRQDATCIYLSGEEFTNRFVLALKSGKLDLFRGRFRSCDVLIIDDIHFLANKKASQEEFLHTFNAIDACGKQLVLASDTHPKMMQEFSDSLTSRFVSGMVVKIDTPSYETRCAILMKRAEKMEKIIPMPVIEYIADNIRTNVRELEGALLKIAAYAALSREPITMALTQEALQGHISNIDPIVRVSDIESKVAKFFALTPADIRSNRKTRTVSLARSLAMYLTRKHTNMSFPEIGRYMGNKNHATVILACRKIETYLADNSKPLAWDTTEGKQEMYLKQLLDKLEESIK